MKVTFIGSGNTATVMARLCKQKEHTIHQFIVRDEVKESLLEKEFDCSVINFKIKPSLDTDIVIVALSDNSLPEALSGINFDHIPVVHTSGSATIYIVEHTSQNYGVLYPLQSLRKEMKDLPEIPFLIEANNESTLNTVYHFAKTISNDVVVQTFEERIRLHTAAVIVNNFTNYLYGVAEKFCRGEKVDFNLLKPIIKETAERVQQNSPLDVQTGPAMRSDITTLDKHLRLLNDYPKLRTLYMRMTDGIMND